jgi:WD40 repeat protein/serine/threonine protein kinase
MSVSAHDNHSMTSGRDPVLDDLIEEIANRIQAGESVDGAAILARYPDRADSIRRLLPAIEVMAEFGVSASRLAAAGVSPESSPIAAELGTLGDFRLVRELGRGGMGIVYEAEQLSLHRRVALKVLPFAAALDARQIQRFQLEAHAAACLHHPHIVPVHGVGCERGVHYYAMQLIDGQSLAAMIAELRRLDGLDPPDGPAPGPDGVSTSELAARLLSGGLLDRPAGASSEAPTEAGPAATTAPLPAAASHPEAPPLPASRTGPARPATSGSSTRNREYVRGAARLALQAAEALDHAHARGIVHRDIKPGNLLLDARGRLWIADFGLAQVRGDDRLTLSGDVLGTLRYMSPEQALGRRVVIDGRTDIYSLGVTLYELLTLRPAVDGRDRAEVLRRIAEREPAPPRQLNPAVPRDLETIITKAMAKDPADRYATAGDLVMDLGRFLEGRPIEARRSSGTERAWRWCRRNPLVASLVAALAAVLVGGFVGMSVLWLRAERNADHARDQQAEAERLAGLEARARSEAEKQTSLAQEQSKSAQERAEELRRRDYISRVNLAYRECLEDNVGRALQLLEDCPKDLRGWEWEYVRHQCHTELRTLRGHSDSVNALAFSPDGTRIVSGGGRPYTHPVAQDRAELILWNTMTGREIVRFAGLKGSVHSVAFSPDGARIASGSGSYGMPVEVEGRVALWDARTGKILADKTERLLNPLSVAFSPDGRLLGAGFGIWSGEHAPGRLRVWDAQTGVDVLTADAPPGGVNQIAFSPDGKTIASACSGVVQLWGVEPPRKLRELKGHTSWIYGVAFSPDGKRLATAGWDKTVRLWDPGSGAELLTIDEHNGNATGVAFSPDGRSLASASEDHTVRMWDAASGRELRRLRGHHAAVLGAAFAPDGRSLASASEDGTVRVWDAALDHKSALSGHTGMVMGVAFSPDGQRVATASGDCTVAVWETTTGTRLLRLAGGKGWVNSVAYSPDGRLIAAAGEYAAAQIWDAVCGCLLRDVEHLDSFVRVVAFSPDGRLLAAGTGVHDFAPNSPGSVYVWDVATGGEILRFRGHAGRVLSLAFSPDSRLIASGGGSPEDRPHPSDEVILWEATTGNVVHRLLDHSRRINGLAISRDGQWLASACEDGVVRIWDVTTGSLIWSRRVPSRGATSLAFHPEGNRLAVGASDRTITLWDPASGELIISLTGHTAAVCGLEFSRDGTRLVSSSFDRTARIWDALPPGDTDSSISRSQGALSRDPIGRR